MKSRKPNAEPTEPEPFKPRKFPPICAADRRHMAHIGQMALPLADTPPPL